MGLDVIESLVDRLIEQASAQPAGFAIVLHGGEPLLLGLENLTFLINRLREKLDSKRYPISLQTNGSLLNKEFLDYFSRLEVSVSVSIDGDQDANDIARFDINGNSTFSKTLKGIQELRSHTDSEFLFAGTLSVIQISVPAKKTYEFLKSIGTPNMDFLMQDGNHDRLPQGKSSFESTEYGNWICELFECYISDPAPVPIRFFDDIIRLLLGGSATKEGQGTDPYGIIIFETDGEIRKNDTLRSSFDGADFFTSRWNVCDTKISDVLASSEFSEYAHMQIPVCKSCKSCEYLDVCGGGMPLYRWSKSHGYDAPSVYCHDHIEIIRSIKKRLAIEGVECP
jgi:Arylsulfatase regulator (Fe-S oxidoreductase)